MDVSIVMPCLNEVQTLEQCIKEGQTALDELHNLRGEIVIADNGSTDGSIELARSLGARVVPIAEKGYGSAILGGVAAARGRYIVMADSDASYDLRECVLMVRRLQEGYDLCMGSRFQGEIMPGAMPWKNRYIGNPALTGVLNLLFRSNLSDAHSGIRAFTKSAFEKMRLQSTGMEFASEMVIKATLLDLKRTEVPVTLRPDGRDRAPHLRPWRDGWRHLRYIFMLSPMWLYFIPALILGVVGGIILALLLLNPQTTAVQVGPIWFGDHWIMIATAAIVAAHQAFVFGLATTLFGVRAGYRRVPGWLRRIYRVTTLENMLITGTLLILFGLGVLGAIFALWSSRGFGSLDMLREIAGATTLMLLGMQTAFGGFLLAIISGNEANVSAVVQTAGETADVGSLMVHREVSS